MGAITNKRSPTSGNRREVQRFEVASNSIDRHRIENDNRPNRFLFTVGNGNRPVKEDTGMPPAPPRRTAPLEVFDDGRLVYADYQSGHRPLLECAETLGDRMVGTHVRMECIDLACARLLVRHGVASVRAERVWSSALPVLSSGSVDLLATRVVDGPLRRQGARHAGIDGASWPC